MVWCLPLRGSVVAYPVRVVDELDLEPPTSSGRCPLAGAPPPADRAARSIQGGLLDEGGQHRPAPPIGPGAGVEQVAVQDGEVGQACRPASDPVRRGLAYADPAVDAASMSTSSIGSWGGTAPLARGPPGRRG